MGEETGHFGRKQTRTYKSWACMKARCLNPNNKNYAQYAGRGISVCKRWLKWNNFFADMGICPDGLELERVKNGRGYYPSNCVWADRSTQMRNTCNTRHLIYEGARMSLAEACEKAGLPRYLVVNRLGKGESTRKALGRPAKPRVVPRSAQIAASLGISEKALWKRIASGWTVEAATTTPKISAKESGAWAKIKPANFRGRK